MNVEQAFEAISIEGWLAEQPSDFRYRLLKKASVRTYEPGQMLFEIGDAVHALVGLVSGSVEVWLHHPVLNRQLLHIAKPGLWFGEQIAYGLDKRSNSVRAKTPVKVIAVPRDAIDAMVTEDPLCLKNFGRLSASHIVSCMRGITELLVQDSFAKVCVRLITLGVAYSLSNYGKPIELPITNGELAGLCGISRKTVNRILGDLKKAGAINSRYGAVTILSLKLLSEIAANDVGRGHAPLHDAP